LQTAPASKVRLSWSTSWCTNKPTKLGFTPKGRVSNGVRLGPAGGVPHPSGVALTVATMRCRLLNRWRELWA
jgi:hypothetical protein